MDEADSLAAGLRDPEVTSKFGFDADEDAWLERCRRSSDGPRPARLGGYELLGDAGRGSQGSVYKAVQPGTGRVVAIKRLGAGRFATPRMLARFDLEIAALSALSHPGIVTVFGTDEVDGQRILLMEWIDGEPIDLWARPRPLRERLAMLALVCDAVNHAHQRGVIHRDLKPSNVLVDKAGSPHVLDFGLARLTRPELGPTMSRTEAFVGTPAYAAPEQIAGRHDDIDTRTDVYALGVVLYELLTGVLPFDSREDLGAVVDAIRTAEPRRPSSLSPRLGAELDAIALKALAKEPHRRYQSVADLADDLRRFLAGHAVLAHAPGRLYRACKFIRRHRVGVAAAAAGVLVLLAGAGATAWQAVRATRAEAQTARERDAARLEARRADAVRDFLTAMLSEASPNAGGSSAMTVREAIDRAAAKLDAGALRDQPEIEDAVRWTLGWVYPPIGGSRAAAAAHFEWVVKHRERTLDPWSPKLADALCCWGTELDASGQPDKAEAALRRGIEIYQVSGPGQWGTLHALLALAEIPRKRGDPQTAVERFHDVIREFDRAAPRYQRQRAWAYYGLALCYRDLHLTSECAAAFEAARPGVEASIALASTHRIWFSLDYCLCVTEPAGRHEDTILILRPLLDAALGPFGEDNPDLCRVTGVLGNALIEAGRAAEAEPLLRRLIEVRDRTSPPNDVRRHTARSLLGWALARLGRPDEAESLLVPAFEAIDADPAAAGVPRARVLERVIRFYEDLGLEENATMYRARLDPGEATPE